jgi:CRP/FNR family cyclic AMP-dependent transcriptional regulator
MRTGRDPSRPKGQAGLVFLRQICAAWRVEFLATCAMLMSPSALARMPRDQDPLWLPLPAHKISSSVFPTPCLPSYSRPRVQSSCYLIDEGLLKVTMVSAAGGERILAILGAGSIVGELSIIDGAPRSTSVGAVRESALRFVSRDHFHAFVDRNPEAYRHIMSVLAKRLRDTNSVVVAASFLTLKGRVARALINLADAFGHDVGGGRIVIRQKVSQSDLAAMTGIARENVSRILNDWKRAKFVTRVSAYYCLENRAAIEREAEL